MHPHSLSRQTLYVPRRESAAVRQMAVMLLPCVHEPSGQSILTCVSTPIGRVFDKAAKPDIAVRTDDQKLSGIPEQPLPFLIDIRSTERNNFGRRQSRLDFVDLGFGRVEDYRQMPRLCPVLEQS